jgi:hypothetical protein
MEFWMSAANAAQEAHVFGLDDSPDPISNSKPDIAVPQQMQMVGLVKAVKHSHTGMQKQ